MAQEDWDPFADPADDPAVVAQAAAEARARAEERAGGAAAAEGFALALPGGSTAERCQQHEREGLEAELVGVGFLEAFPPPSLAPGELCVAHFVLDARPADVILELPRLDAEARRSTGARTLPVVGGGLLAVWQDGRAELLEPAPAWELARHGQRCVAGEAGHSRALAHTAATLLPWMFEAAASPQPSDVRSKREHAYVELRDICHFAPLGTGCSERTLMRRSIWGLEVLQGDALLDLKERLCNRFESEIRSWVARWAPEALGPPLPAQLPPAPACGGGKLAVAGTGLGSRSSGPPPALTLEQALRMQDMLIAEYSKTAFQVRLHEGWAAARGDQVMQLKARREACLPIQGPIVEHFGFEPTQKGVNQSVVAFKPLNEHPEVAKRNMTMQYLVNPQQQDQDFIEGHFSACVQASASLLYGALRLPELYKADKELVALARAGAASRVRLRIEQNLSDPNIVVPDRLGFINEARSRFYFIEERTPLVAAVEAGQAGVFELLLGYLHLVDVNRVCLEWSITDCYKRYTALDLGQACARNKAHAAAASMVQRLLAVGGRPADELPHPRRENPFKNWQEHFPDASLYNIGAEDASNGMEGGGVNYGHDPDSAMPGGHSPGWSPGFGGSRGGDATPGPPDGNSRRGRTGFWRFPASPAGAGPELERAISKLKQRMLSQGCDEAEGQRFLRHLFLEWHPDKNPHEQELATKVFQWLQGVKDSFP